MRQVKIKPCENYAGLGTSEVYDYMSQSTLCLAYAEKKIRAGKPLAGLSLYDFFSYFVGDYWFDIDDQEADSKFEALFHSVFTAPQLDSAFPTNQVLTVNHHTMCQFRKIMEHAFNKYLEINQDKIQTALAAERNAQILDETASAAGL